jgi:putative thiamine transport system permease protein
MKPEGRALRLGVLALVMAGLVLPILAGAVQTLRAAFGLHDALQGAGFSLAPWAKLAALPGFETSLRLTLVTGIGSTILALMLAIGLCAAVHGRMGEQTSNRLLTPILAVPHAALAIGLAFLIAPAGWIARLVGSVLGWSVPPQIASVHDSAGMALLLGLVVKELPFLLLVMLGALRQVPVAQHLAAGGALGYGRGAVWGKIILPQLWPLIRLPVLVVQAYALSSVDMAMILGPSNPPTLAVAVTRWLSDADLAMIYPASAGALLVAGVVVLSCGAWVLAERLAGVAGLWWLRRGARDGALGAVLNLTAGVGFAMLVLGILSLLVLVLWSFAYRWSFPAPLPDWTLSSWAAPQIGWGRAAGYSLGIGLAVTALSVALAVAWLEAEDRGGMRRAGWAEALIYLPLLLPQIAFLYGLNLLFLRLGISGGVPAVIWAQGLFVFPYVMIALSEPWRALDPSLIRTAASLGAGPGRRLFRVKLPALLGPVLTAAAIGFAVSIAQYLPTLFMGAGRIATLTTEAVTLSSGSDRRVIGTYAVLQALLPFAAYGLALLLPRVLYRDRRGLRGGY